VNGNFDLAAIMTPWVFGYLAVFCRVGAAFMLFPGIGEAQVPSRVRLLLALAVSLPVTMAVPGIPTQPPTAISQWAGMILSNLAVGAFFGIAGRIMLSALYFAGQVMSMTIGLMNPFGASAPGFEGASALTALLVFAGIAAMFAANLHHHLIEAIVGSFSVVGIAGTPDIPGQAMAAARLLGQSTAMAVKFAAPFLVIGLVFNAGLGVANRLMPNLAVYFVFSPALIALGFLLLGIVSSAIVLTFAESLGDFLQTF